MRLPQLGTLLVLWMLFVPRVTAQDVSSIPDGTVRQSPPPEESASEDTKDEGASAEDSAETPKPYPPQDSTDSPPDPEELVDSPKPDAEEAPEATPSKMLRISIVDSATYGIDPVVGKHVDLRLRKAAKEAGYQVVSRDLTVRAAQANNMPYPPSPADLWRITFAAGAQRGVFVKVWAQAGKYVYEVTVASLDGTGPFFARGSSVAEKLHETVSVLLLEALPSSSDWNEEKADELATKPAKKADVAAEPKPFLQAPVYARFKRVNNRPNRRWDIAFQTEAAFGLSSDFFYNHLLGVRVGFRITNDTHLGWYLGYTNLRGRNGRLSNFLPYMQVEHRIRIKPSSDVSIPLRGGFGYLPFNGPFFRLGVGVNIPFSDRMEVAFDILAPTFWVLPEKVAVSLNVAVELILRLGSKKANTEEADEN